MRRLSKSIIWAETPLIIVREEFADHGLTQVHLQHRNVCKDGFGVLTNIEAGKLAGIL